MNTVRSRAVLLLLAAATLVPLAAGAQVRITGAITGLVTDPSDAVIPGATVQLIDEGTGITKETVTNTSGVFQFLDLNSGRYTVSVTLQGFQTAKYEHVVVEASRSTDLRVKLGVGATTETVTVSGAAPVLETSQNAISTTLDRKQITELPLNSRDAFGLARLVPGAVALPGASGSTAGQSGSTHYNGMPGGTINPTLDGVNNSSNGFKSGGTSFFGTVPARLGAVEEITVESAGLGGDAGVEGGVNLKFVTRRGTRNYHAQRVRSAAERHPQRQQLLQHLARHRRSARCASTTSASTSAARWCRPGSGATSCSCSSTTSSSTCRRRRRAATSS